MPFSLSALDVVISPARYVHAKKEFRLQAHMHQDRVRGCTVHLLASLSVM